MLVDSISILDMAIEIVNGIFPVYMVPLGISLGISLGLVILSIIARAFKSMLIDGTDYTGFHTPPADQEAPAPELNHVKIYAQPEKKKSILQCPYCDSRIKARWRNCKSCGGPLGPDQFK